MCFGTGHCRGMPQDAAGNTTKGPGLALTVAKRPSVNNMIYL